MIQFSEAEFAIQRRVQSLRQKWLVGKTSHPHLSGDAFAAIADLRIASIEGLSPKDLESKVIHIKGHLLVEFLKRYREELNDKIIISGNSDENFLSPPAEAEILKKLYCQNLVNLDGSDKYITLPIGLENLSLGGSGLPKFHRISKKPRMNHRILVPPMSPTNPIRGKMLLDIKKHNSIFDIVERKMSRREYFRLVSKYRFVLVLEGNGFDTHRLWETLYQGSFPVQLSTPWSLSLKALQLPILYFHEIEELTPSRLNEFHTENSDFNPELWEVLWVPYWEKRIREIKEFN